MAAPVAQNAAADKSLGELLRDLSDGSVELVREEIRLARTETVESLLELKHGAVWIGMGVALALGAAGAGIAFLVLVLSRYALEGRTWLAALIVAVVLDLIGWLCVRRGMHAMSSARLAPRETANSIKETAVWLKHPARSAAS